MTTQAYPGQVLAGNLAAMGGRQTELARQLHIPVNRITQIIQGKRGITSDSAQSLGHWFGDVSEFWLSLQAQHELREAAREVGRVISSLPRHPVQAGMR